MKKDKKLFIIIDGNSLVNRAFYAVQRPMITKEGMYTQGIYGFMNMLNKILKDYEPEYMAVAFDMKGATFRHEAYEEYKAGRKKMPVELAMQIPVLKDVLNALNISYIEKAGYEADDLIGTMAGIGQDKGLKTLIVSGDKDQLQLVSDNTNVLFTKRGVSHFDLYDLAKMEEVYGFGPEEFIDLKGLMGDKSDNIPGVPGVGEKTASKLIIEYGSIENIYEHLEEIKPEGLKKKLTENKLSAFMSKNLATIECNVPMEQDISDWLIEKPNYPELIKLYEKLEFRSFLSKLSIEGSQSELDNNVQKQLIRIDNSKVLTELEKRFMDTEKKGMDVGIKILSDFNHIGIPSLEKIYFAFEDVVTEILPDSIHEVICLIEKYSPKLYGHDIKKDLYVLMSYGYKDSFEGTKISFDTDIAYYLISGGTGLKNFNELCVKHGHSFEEFNIKNYFSIIESIKEIQKEDIEKQNLKKLFEEVELPLVRLMAQMEFNGISVNKEILEQLGSEVKEKIEILTKKIYDLAGEEFNISSPSQLGRILFEKLGLTKGKKTKTGYSTNADALAKIIDEHEIVRLIVEYRGLTKINSTYVEGLLPLIADDGKIHGSFHQTVTATGRLSSSDPNMQNIPIRQEIGIRIREAFIPSKANNKFVGGDYSQIELRILAHMSQDPDLMDAFNNGEDIHRATASKVLGLSPEDITPLQRSRAKAINFGVIYGMSGFGLSEELGITRKEADKYIKDYFLKHEPVKKFMDGEIAFAKEKGYVATLLGRRRYINEIKAGNYMVRQLGERLAMNTPIQGSAADIIKIAMVKVGAALDGMKSRLLLQIHDELIIEAAEDELDQIKSIIVDNMESAMKLNVNLAVDVHMGKNWRELK